MQQLKINVSIGFSRPINGTSVACGSTPVWEAVEIQGVHITPVGILPMCTLAGHVSVTVIYSWPVELVWL